MVPAGEDGICFPIRFPLHEIRPVHLIGPPHASGTLNRLAVPFPGSRIRGKQVIPPLPFENMGALQEDPVRLVDIPHRAGHGFPDRIIFLQHQPPCIFLGDTVIRAHADHVFSSVLVMEKGRVKSEIVQFHRF